MSSYIRVVEMAMVEMKMEEAIAKACISSRAPLSSSLHLRVTNDASFQPSLAFLSKISGHVHTWADNLNCELSSFN